MEKFMTMLDKENMNQVVQTENGANTYNSTGEYLLDLFYNIPSLRENPYKFETTFEKAYNEDKNLAIRWLLYLRDIRDGIGERKSFRVLFTDFASRHPRVATEILKHCNIQDLGRWDDLVYIWYSLREIEPDVALQVKYILMEQLNEDIKKCADAKELNEDCHISLLGKWMPSINTTSKSTRHIANELAKEFKLTAKQYRTMLSVLRKHSNVTEVDTSANNWGNIDYEKVPSNANLKYKDAFLRHDADRRKEFLTKLKEGKATIKAGTLFMYDIIRRYRDRYGRWSREVGDEDDTLEELWKNITPPTTLRNTLVVRDGSFSMTSRINGDVFAMDVGDSICIFLSQFNTGDFKNKFITFSSRPEIVDLTNTEDDSLHSKLGLLSKYDDCSNTNIKKVFDLILKTAINNNISQEDMPEQIVIVSDMQFDYVSTPDDETVFEYFIKEYKDHGYDMPKLIFWNVGTYLDKNVPVKKNKLGVILMSGFSKNMIDMVVNNELDPYKALVKKLKVKKYDCVDSIEF